MLLCVVIFFKVLYGYKEERPNPIEIKELIEEYRTQTDDEKSIIIALNESMVISYRDATINDSIENEKHNKQFGLFYKIIFIEVFLLIITFLIELPM